MWIAAVLQPGFGLALNVSEGKSYLEEIQAVRTSLLILLRKKDSWRYRSILFHGKLIIRLDGVRSLGAT